MAVPLAIHLSTHSQLIPRMKLLPLAYWFIAGLAVVTAVGTYERSALIGIVVLAVYMWMRIQAQNWLRHGRRGRRLPDGLHDVQRLESARLQRSATLSRRIRPTPAFWCGDGRWGSPRPIRWAAVSRPIVINHIEFPATATQPATIEFGTRIPQHLLRNARRAGLSGPGHVPGLIGYYVLQAAPDRQAGPRLSGTGMGRRACRTRCKAAWRCFMSAARSSASRFSRCTWYFIAMSISLNAYVGGYSGWR